jgi:hypothetical protein
MKYLKFLFLATFVLNVSMVMSQEKGSYRHVPELNKYVGTWKWRHGDSTLVITLKKTEIHSKKMDNRAPDASADILIGWHKFSVGGKVIQSSMNMKSDTFDYKFKNQTIFGGINQTMRGGIPHNEGYLAIHFHDLVTGANTTSGKFSLLKGGKKANLELSDTREWSSLNKNDRSPHFSLPMDIIMKKIK